MSDPRRYDADLCGVAYITITVGGQDIRYHASTLEFAKRTLLTSAWLNFLQTRHVESGFTYMDGPEVERDGYVICYKGDLTQVTLQEDPRVREVVGSDFLKGYLKKYSTYAIGEFCVRAALGVDQVIDKLAGTNELALIKLIKLLPQIKEYCAVEPVQENLRRLFQGG